jgi:hypothetical protein
MGGGGWRNQGTDLTWSLPSCYPSLRTDENPQKSSIQHSVRDRGVGGSNPLAPTKILESKGRIPSGVRPLYLWQVARDGSRWAVVGVDQQDLDRNRSLSLLFTNEPWDGLFASRYAAGQRRPGCSGTPYRCTSRQPTCGNPNSATVRVGITIGNERAQETRKPQLRR